MSVLSFKLSDLDEGEVEVVLNSSSRQQTIKAPALLQQPTAQTPIEQQTSEHRPVIGKDKLHYSGWSSRALWVLFGLGWVFPPFWWVATAAGLTSGGGAQCFIQRRTGQSRVQTAAWRASLVMTVLSADVLVLVLPIYYSRGTVEKAGE